MHGKPHFLFPDVMKRWSFQKDRWNMIFLILSRKMIFLFPENMILPLGWEMKDDLSQKSTWKYDIFFTYSEKMVCSELALEYDLSCIIWKDGIFFPENIWAENEG